VSRKDAKEGRKKAYQALGRGEKGRNEGNKKYGPARTLNLTNQLSHTTSLPALCFRPPGGGPFVGCKVIKG
jgi:hypothetical protein